MPLPVYFRSALDQARLLRARKIGARELLDLCWARVEKHNPLLNAVIVSDIGAAPETILPAGPGKRDDTGWIVPCRDPAAIAERVAEALSLSPERRAALGARARRRIAAKFSLHHMQRATLAVYDELLGTNLAARFDAVAV